MTAVRSFGSTIAERKALLGAWSIKARLARRTKRATVGPSDPGSGTSESKIALGRCVKTMVRSRPILVATHPEAMDEAKRIFGDRDDLVFADSPAAALDGADALIVVTEWKAFWSPDFPALQAALKEPAVFDGRNIYDPAAVEAAGLAYYGIGRGRSVAGRD